MPSGLQLTVGAAIVTFAGLWLWQATRIEAMKHDISKLQVEWQQVNRGIDDSQDK